MYTYEWQQWIIFFIVYCFFGWIFESVYVSLKKRHFVNRGFLRIPMLPLYGTGAVMMLWVSLPVKESLVLVYIAGVLAATVLEYVTGFAMERLFKMKYWDYSGQHCQLHGYICLSSSLAWGGLTILLTEVIHNPIERLVLGMSPLIEYGIILVVGTIFIMDTVQSTKAAFDLGRVLESMTKMRAELEDLQVQLALLKESTIQKVANMRESAQETFDAIDLNSNQHLEFSELKIAAAEHTTRMMEELQRKITSLSENRLSLFQRLTAHKIRILRDNPSATSRRFSEAFHEIKDILESKRR